MAKQRLTPWFPGHIKPVRDGVYEAIHGGWERGFARFERGIWQTLLPTIEDAASSRFHHGASQDKQWRGLARKPRG